jgi:pimeloyl-ACP methyl ester carboxylesterase
MRKQLASFVVVATMATLAIGSPAHAGGRVAWGDCPAADPEFPRDPRLECARLRVPLDYRKPRGRQITITISRIPAAEPSRRQGVLLTNPGGPGAPGLDWAGAMAGVLPEEVLARYDIIGFDARGVGHSTPVTCGLTLDSLVEMLPGYPAPDGSIARNVEFARKTARSCAAHSGDLLPYITTANTARDMDRIRAALGETTISYLGFSYGTYLGAVYASLFPRAGDRIVLDSAIDPNLVWYGIWRTWGQAVNSRLGDFTAWAAARDDVYHLGATPGAVRQTYLRLAGALDREPLELPDETITGNIFREVTRSFLYDDVFFPELASIWQFLADPSGPSDVASRLAQTVNRATAAGVPGDYPQAALYAVVCGDVSWPRDPAVYQRNVAADRRAWPVTAGMPANIWPCAFWESQPVEPPVKVTGSGPRSVLILQNLRDPATSWRSGYGLRVALGRRAAFVTQDAGGHSVYGAHPGECVSTIATTFLTRGTLPARDRWCPGPTPDDVTGPPLTARGLLAP